MPDRWFNTLLWFQAYALNTWIISVIHFVASGKNSSVEIKRRWVAVYEKDRRNLNLNTIQDFENKDRGKVRTNIDKLFKTVASCCLVLYFHSCFSDSILVCLLYLGCFVVFTAKAGLQNWPDALTHPREVLSLTKPVDQKAPSPRMAKTYKREF